MKSSIFKKTALGSISMLAIIAVHASQTDTTQPAATVAPTIAPVDRAMTVATKKYPGKVYFLAATPDTTQWGWFDNAEPPRLKINSGDTVLFETLSHSHGQLYPGKTIEELKKLRTDWPGRGPMTLTGPVYVEGAEPGDVLKLTINKIVSRPWGANFNVPGMFGQFPKDYPEGQVKYLYLDWDKKVTEFLPGIEVPLRPFPGTLGVARKEPGRYSAVPPGPFAGNLDNRDLVEGTTLYVPVFVPGALVWTGDSHAAQGNGEINLTAIETAFEEMSVTITVDKKKKLEMPRIETKTDWITMGYDVDLNKALDQAKSESVKMISELRGVSTEQAEKLFPKVADCRVTQVVDIKKGVHCMIPKDSKKQLTEVRPKGDTTQYLVSYQAGPDMNQNADMASKKMLAKLEGEKGLKRLDAYGLASVSMDCRVGEMIANDKSISCLMAKNMWVKN